MLVDLLRTVAGNRAGSLRILDYGCGTGGNTQAYSSLGEVVGIEPEASAIRLANRRGGAWYCRANGIHLPFRHGVFDVVLASDVLEHIENDTAAVAEIARVTQVGGIGIMSVPAHQWLFSEHDIALQHFRRYSKVALRALLQDSGFRIRRISYWNTFLFPLVCLHRSAQKGCRIEDPHSDTVLAPWLINESLTALLGVEATALRYTSLPWGLSLVVVAQRV
jgi:SAM-dependent methyltransferase